MRMHCKEGQAPCAPCAQPMLPTANSFKLLPAPQGNTGHLRFMQLLKCLYPAATALDLRLLMQMAKGNVSVGSLAAALQTTASPGCCTPKKRVPGCCTPNNRVPWLLHSKQTRHRGCCTPDKRVTVAAAL